MAEALTYRGTVQAWHCDHIGHMNVMWYVGKFDEGTWNLFALAGITAAYLRDNKAGMAAVQQNISYKREVMAGEVVTVRSRVIEVRERVVRFVHVMTQGDGAEAATCELTAVHTDAVSRKASAFPPAIAARLRDMMAP